MLVGPNARDHTLWERHAFTKYADYSRKSEVGKVVFPSPRSSRIFVTAAKYSLTYGPTVRTMPFVVSLRWMIEIH